jgi:hypothetical protein
MRPSRRSIKRVCRRISEVTSRRWLCKKHKRQGQGSARFPDEDLYAIMVGCNDCRCACVTFRVRRHETLSERRMREIRTSGATSGDWKWSYGQN